MTAPRNPRPERTLYAIRPHRSRHVSLVPRLRSARKQSKAPDVDAPTRGAQHEMRSAGADFSVQRILIVTALHRDRNLAVDASAAGVRIEIEIRVRGERDGDAAAGGR